MCVEYNVKEIRRLKSIVKKHDELLKARDGEIEDLRAQLLLKETEAAKITHLRAQTSNLEVVENSLRDEVNALKECNIILEKEQNALDVKVTDLEALVVGKERDLTDLNAQLTSVHELEMSSARLQEKITVYDNCMEQLEKFQDDRMKIVNEKLAKLDVDLAEMACHLEEKFYPHLLNTISGRRWLLTHSLKLFLVKCLNSSEYLMALGLLSTMLLRRECRVVLRPALIMVDFPLLAELKSHKDASTKEIINVLRLEGALADAPGISDLQPDIEYLMGEASMFGVVLAASVRTTALSTTFAFAIFIPPISTDDFKIVGVNGQGGACTDGQTVADGNVAPFPNVDDVELNIP
ncbi:hypothetical protein Tco_1288362 [Tanacetum coccineum]